MTTEEKSKLIIELTRMRAEDQRRIEGLLSRLDAMVEAQAEGNRKLGDLMDDLRKERAARREESEARKRDAENHKGVARRAGAAQNGQVRP